MDRKDRKQVRLAWSDGSKVVVDALVFGLWCVHEAPLLVGGYRVTFIPKGMGLHGLADGFSKREAIQIAERLNAIPKKDLCTPCARYMIEAIVAEVLSR